LPRSSATNGWIALAVAKPAPYVIASMSEIEFRRAQAPDLPAIVALLADDDLGESREDPSTPLAPSYLDAFRAIDADPNQLLAVAVEAGKWLEPCSSASFRAFPGKAPGAASSKAFASPATGGPAASASR
jgi:hypothetical protein